jgi:hypothetical protein
MATVFIQNNHGLLVNMDEEVGMTMMKFSRAISWVKWLNGEKNNVSKHWFFHCSTILPG